MKNEKWDHILVCYLGQHRMPVLMFLAYSCIFAFIFSLYDLESEAVFYAAGLCVLLSVVVLSIHFFFYRKRHADCIRMLPDIQFLMDALPAPRTLMEKDLQDLLREMGHIVETNLTHWQEERSESIDYYSTWVHQIKTPISVMRMTLENEDTEEHRVLLAELFRIEQYVEMVLSYLRLGSDTTDYIFKEYELDGIIRKAVHKYAPQFVNRRIRLYYTPVSVQVLTDEKWLLFMIEQVLSNSIKYTPAGAVTITVTEDKILKIADTGIGIAPEDLPRIFEKGFTGYNGHADKKSSGLGLYLCKRAAGHLSHKISAASVPGQGTVISIDLHTDNYNSW